MNVQYIKKGKETEWVVLPYREYLELVEKAESLDEIRDYDQAKAALENGEMEAIPSEVVNALLDGKNPIRVWREFRGLTQQQLAGQAEISIPYLSQLETGKRRGALNVLSAISHTLHLSLDDITNEPIEVNPSQTKRNNLATPSEIPLSRGKKAEGRKALAAIYGINEEKIQYFFESTDLYQINGVGSEYYDLLSLAGIHSIAELAQCNASDLLSEMTVKNDEYHVVRRLPDDVEVKHWIGEAKKILQTIPSAHIPIGKKHQE